MKTIRIRGLGKPSARIELTEVDKPTLRAPDDVLVRVLCIGLDGTDRELLQEHYGTPPPGETDLTNGHESLGVVVEAGERSGLKPGVLVTALVRRPCLLPSCVNCRNGRQDFCETGEYTERGIKGAHGYLAEYYVESARYLVQVAPECLAYGVLAEPQSIVEKVWAEAQHIQQRLIWEPRTALVLGSGPLGLLGALMCRCLGLAVHVWSLEPEDSPGAAIVRDMGAVYVQAPSGKPEASGAKAVQASTAKAKDASGVKAVQASLEEADQHRAESQRQGLSEATGQSSASIQTDLTLTRYLEQQGIRPDIILECTGYSPLAFEAIDALAPNGVLGLLGVTPGKRRINVPSDRLNQELVLENKCVLGSVNASRKDFETGLYRLKQANEAFPGLLDRLITERLHLEDVPRLDFANIRIKAVVDVVPRNEWAKLVGAGEEAVYSFSV